MAWNDSIPQPGNKLRVSQGDLLNNFIALNTYLTVNHTDIDGTGEQGKHKVISMPAQAATPVSPPLDGTDIGLFAKVWATTAANELFLRESGPVYIPLTGSYLLFSALRDAWMFLPGGILIKWNTITLTALSVGTYTFTTANSEPTFLASASLLYSTAQVGVDSSIVTCGDVTTTNFGYSNGESVDVDITFIAWGIPTPITP